MRKNIGKQVFQYKKHDIRVNNYVVKTDELPFEVKKDSILFIENAYSIDANSFIQNNYLEIMRVFEKKGLEFVYIPYAKQWKDLATFKSELLYTIPQIKDADAEKVFQNIVSITTRSYANELLNQILNSLIETTTSPFDALELLGLQIPETVHIGLLRSLQNDINETVFYYVPLDSIHPNDFLDFFQFFLENLFVEKLSENLLSIAPRPNQEQYGDDYADAAFYGEAQIIANEIKQKIDLLQAKGYRQLLLQLLASTLNQADKESVLLDNTKTNKLSRIIIDSDFKIWLPDFNNLEIKLTSLPKTVFFLFLNHPEGIVFKHLSNYKDELMFIYQRIAYRHGVEEMTYSINEICDPRSNSINEKCSRIKEAFVTHFNEAIAENYFITGKRGEPKKIKIAAFDMIKGGIGNSSFRT